MPSSNKVRKVTSENYPTDAGREGEAIFRRVYALAGSNLPIKRLWISSMEDAAIQQGFENLKDGAAYDNLFAASECRAKADWLIGMNGTRAFTKKYGRKQTIGRVQTPTLAMLAERQAKIQNFVKEPYYKVELSGAGVVAVSEQMAQEQDADAMQVACDGQCAVVGSIERKRVEKKPPKLYDLTTLQREANRYYGLPASQTLQALQELYEEKLVTYPRTDSQFVTEDMRKTVESLVLALDGQTVDVSCVINNSKVTDHHAILPTASMAKADLSALPAGELSVLRLITARLLCAVGEAHRYAETILTTTCAGEEFTAKGKVVLSEGWKSIEYKLLGDLLSKKNNAAVLPDVQAESECGISGAELKEGQTSPPKHFNEDLLLHAMETASADSMPEGVERQGIGTPATRAATIEKLVAKGFLERKGDKKTKSLLPTDKGKALITVMPEQIQSADMTAEWEAKLLRIERGEMEPEEFMTEIQELLTA